MNSVVHFEMPYEDAKRMSKFYESAFGWKMQELGPAMSNYVLATTTRTGKNGPLKPGAINGGFFPRKPDRPAEHPMLVVAVKDIREAMRKVLSAGGQIVGDPVAIPGVGDYVSVVDTEGNCVNMLKPVPPGRRGPKK